MCWCFIHYWIEKCMVKQWTSYPVILKTVKLRSFCWFHTVFVFQVHNYVGEWLQYQSLWDLQADNLYGKLGEDINLWMKCLNDIKWVTLHVLGGDEIVFVLCYAVPCSSQWNVRWAVAPFGLLSFSCVFLIKPTNALISQIYFVEKLYMFRAVPPHIIRSLPLYIWHWYMS